MATVKNGKAPVIPNVPGMNSKEQEELSKERIRKMAPMAKEILQMIANSSVKVDAENAHDNDAYAAVAKDVLKLLLDNDIRYLDKNFIFQLVLRPIEDIQQIVLRSLSHSFDAVLERTFKKDFNDLTLGDLDKVIKSTAVVHNPETIQGN